MSAPKQPKQQHDEISGRGFERGVVLRLLPYLRPHSARVAFASLLVLGSAGIAIYGPRLLGRIVDQALLPRDHTLLYRLVGLYLGLELVRVACVFGQSHSLQSVGQEVMQAIRRDLLARLLRMPVPFFDKNPVGKLVTRVTNDTVNLSELFSAGFVMLFTDLLLIAGVITAMLWMHAGLGLWAISVFPLMILCMAYFSGRLRETFRSSREVLGRLNAFFAERMQGMPVTQLMEREAFERAGYGAVSREYLDRQSDGIHLHSLFQPAITILSGASIAMVLWFGPGHLESGSIPLGTFVSFLAYCQLLYQPVRSITERYNTFLAAMSSAERIFALMDMHEEEGLRDTSRAGGRRRFDGDPLSGELELENVTFAYPTPSTDGTHEPALSGLSFRLAEGETAAIVGHTGAGKSTLASLLFRFYEPSRGRILLGGRELSTIPKPELRARIGFVQQEVFLFSGTLRENLSLLRRDLSDREILEACERTGFFRVLERFPAKLDTLLDERGSNLSLGERQILAFTRVYLQRPDLLVLDEATSSVDHLSEQLLKRATQELMRGRSALVIAHRLETVRQAHRILVLERGRLVEQGSHETLLRENGRYARFVRLQNGAQAAEDGGLIT